MITPPTGTVTFLLTDIEGSTKLSQQFPEELPALVLRHNEVLHRAIDAHNGYVFQTTGDSFAIAFHGAEDALKAALEAQRLLRDEAWSPAPIKVRMGIHMGAAQLLESTELRYSGYAVIAMTQRIMSAGHGGQILVSQAVQEILKNKLPAAVTLRDMGKQRLKDAVDLERLFQVEAPDLPGEFPALKTLDAYRHNLPAQTTSFVGREKEVAEIKQAVAEYRLVTLTGPGGTGKTRLSLKIAADLLESFPSGIWFVELAPLTDPDLIPQTILSAAGTQAQPGRSAQDSLADFLREKTSLLVLDNCEHLIDACARLTDALLSTAPGLKILTSSREALGVRGEQAWRVPSLTLPDVKHLPAIEVLSQYESVRLFVERARLVNPHFAVTDGNALAVAQICHRLDGIPLAIELAAARIRMLTVEEISARLDDRFRLLTGGSRTALPRQQTLRALIDWSYDLLSENERTLLRRLAVFSSSCTLEAVEQICSDANVSAYDVMDLLTHLVDKSLVALEEHPAHTRYRILETVRQYAREKLLESGEGERVRKKHFDYFFKLSAAAEPYALYGVKQIEWLDRLDDELDNFHAALEWSLEHKMEQGAELVAQLWWFWDRRGHWLEGYDWTLRALEIAADGTSLRAKLLAEAGWLASELVYHQRSIDHAAESVALYRALGDTAGLAVPLITLGDENKDVGNIEEAKKFYDESYALLEVTQNKWGLRYIMLNGYTPFAHRDGKYEEMQAIIEKALGMAREAGDREGICFALFWQGQHAVAVGDYARAKESYAEGLKIAREARYPDMIILNLQNMAYLFFELGEYDRENALLEEILQMNKELGDKNGTARTLLHMGRVARKQGHYEKARHLYAEVLTAFYDPDRKRTTFIALVETAFLNEALGKFRAAALLFGAVETVMPEVSKTMPSNFLAEYDQTKASCRGNLGVEAFNAAYAEGAVMMLEQIVAYALEETQ